MSAAVYRSCSGERTADADWNGASGRPSGRLMNESDYIVPDVLAPGLVTVFCGRAPSPESARQRAYYAHFSNQFWKILADVGMTDRQLTPKEFHLLPNFGIGLTDINKTESGSDHELSGSGDSPMTVYGKIKIHQPRILAFNGKNNCRMFLNAVFKEPKNLPIDYGIQEPYVVGDTKIFLLPNTSARARAFWQPEHWRSLAVMHKNLLNA